ncbi:MAG: hypothetical protein C4555_05070 [Dehalococcoidia bacterium]|nr:MAG: hypothetical protein C4555_05070 [Dehalococcoidia bacterium]
MAMQALKPQVQPVGASGGQPNIYAAGRQEVPESRPDTQVIDAVGQFGRGLGQYAGMIADADLRLQQEREALELVKWTGDFRAAKDKDFNEIYRDKRGKEAVGMTKQGMKEFEEARKAYAEMIESPRVRAEFLIRTESIGSDYADRLATVEASAHEEDKKLTVAGMLATNEQQARAYAREGNLAGLKAVMERDKGDFEALYSGQNNTAYHAQRGKALASAFIEEASTLNPAIVNGDLLKALEGIVDGADLKRAADASKLKLDEMVVTSIVDTVSELDSYDKAHDKIYDPEENWTPDQRKQADDLVWTRFQRSEAAEQQAQRDTDDELNEAFVKGYSNKSLTPKAILDSAASPQVKEHWLDQIEARTRYERERAAVAAHRSTMESEQKKQTRMMAEARAEDIAAKKTYKDTYKAFSEGRLTDAGLEAVRDRLQPAQYIEFKQALQGKARVVPAASGQLWFNDPLKKGAALNGQDVVDVVAPLWQMVNTGLIKTNAQISTYIGKGVSPETGLAMMETRRKALASAQAKVNEDSFSRAYGLLAGTFGGTQSPAYFQVAQAFTQQARTYNLQGDDIFSLARDFAADGGVYGERAAQALGYGGDAETLAERYESLDGPTRARAEQAVMSAHPRIPRNSEKFMQLVIQTAFSGRPSTWTRATK